MGGIRRNDLMAGVGVSGLADPGVAQEAADFVSVSSVATVRRKV